MIEATSCGGVVIYHGKILTLFKNYKNKYEGWVLPKGTVEIGETFEQTALREVYEETGAKARIVQFIGTSHYTFNTSNDIIDKKVHWFLMKTNSYFSRPQRLNSSYSSAIIISFAYGNVFIHSQKLLHSSSL